MNAAAALSKGAATRDLILERAHTIAASAGLEGLSIGPLADAVGMSKSGVFAHFGSREDLQLAVLDLAAQRFAEHTLLPALAQPRGLRRLGAIVEQWFTWLRQDHRCGCVLMSAMSEYDDRPGALQDRVVAHHRRWRGEIVRAVTLSVQTGELRADTDAEQLAFEINAIALAVQHDVAISDYDTAIARGKVLFQRLIAAHLVPAHLTPASAAG